MKWFVKLRIHPNEYFSKWWEYLPAFCRLSHSIFCLEIESIDNFDKFHRKAKLKISQWVVKILNEIY